MKHLKTKKTVLLLAVLVVAAVAAFGAYAYWTTGGSGTGSATAGNTTNNLIVSGTASATIYPGSNVALPVRVDNPNSFSVRTASVTGTIKTDDLNTPAGSAQDVFGAPGCKAAWFSFNGNGVAGSGAALDTSGTTIAAAVGAVNGTRTFNGATLSMTDDAVTNQNACKLQSIPVVFSAS